MHTDDSYLNQRRIERRRQVRSGIAGVGLLLALGLGLLLSYPVPNPLPTSADQALSTTSQADSAVVTSTSLR